MKVKVIDLLNTPLDKLPKKIKIEDRIYTLYINEANQHYYKCKYFLFSICCFDELNNEVEIIEEKKIPEKIPYHFSLDYIDCNINETAKEEIDKTINHIYDKINEIIDYLQSKGKNND